jgi:hypothetical protein
MATLFERLAAGRPATEKTTQRPQHIEHAQKLLNWIQRWDRPVVRARDIYIFGPRPRDRKSVFDAARILAEQGWLNPIQSRRYDSREWLIIRKPVICPTVASEAD